MSALLAGPLLGVVAIAAAVALLTYTFWLAGLGRGDDASRGGEPASLAHVRWGMFYVNPDDPRGWVPKPSGLGVTLNLRTEAHLRRYAALIVVAFGSAMAMVAVLLGAG